MKRILVVKFNNHVSKLQLEGAKQVLIKTLGDEYHVFVFNSEFVTEPTFEIVYDHNFNNEGIING